MSSLISCVAAAKMQLDIEVTDQDLWLRKRAQDAMRLFNNPDVQIKVEADFDVDVNGRFKLPNDFYQCVVVRTHPIPECDTDTDNDSDHHHHHRHLNLVYIDRPFFNKCGASVHGKHDCFGSFQINGDFVQINGDFRSIKKASMCYLAYPTDEHGQACVPDNYEEAIMYFLCWNYALKKRFSADIRNEYYKSWVARFNKVNGDSQVNYFQRVKPQMMELFNSVVKNKNIYITG